MMKRLFALMLTLVLCLASTAALAEENAIVVDAPQGSTYVYEACGFSIIVPDELVQTDVSDEDAALGAVDMFMAEDGSKLLQLRIAEVEADFDVQAYYESLATTEGVVSPAVGSINGISWITYSTTDNQAVAVTNVSDTLFLTMIAVPGDDDAWIATYAQILGSIARYPAE